MEPTEQINTSKVEQEQNEPKVEKPELTEEEKAKKRELKKIAKTERYEAKKAYQRA